MDKLITLPSLDANGDLTTHYLESMTSASFEKTAGVLPKEAEVYMKGCCPDPKFLYLLIAALGAADAWGSNVNGDAFFKDDLLGVQSILESKRNPYPYTNKPMQRYKTFTFAKVFKHHQNKPHMGHPSFGHVELPIWDDNMKRVLLIVAINKADAPDIIKDADSGNLVWSMGTKVPYDVCSICQNKAKTINTYCNHLKYQMNQILPSGQKVYAINTMPRFFDISRVLIEADKTAKTLMKIASATVSKSCNIPDYYSTIDNDQFSKVASCGLSTIPSAFAAEHMKVAMKLAGVKQGEITKEIPAETIDHSEDNTDSNKNILNKMKVLISKEPSLPKDSISDLAKFPMNNILSSMAGVGMVMQPKEMKKIIIIRSNTPKKVKLSPDLIKSNIINILSKFMKERSSFSPCIEERLENIEGSEKYASENLNSIGNIYSEYCTCLNNWNVDYSKDVLVKYAEVLALKDISIADAFFGMPKIASAGGVAKVGLTVGSLLAPYYGSAYYRLKSAKNGASIKGVKKIIAEHPGAVSASGTGGLLYLLSKLK